MLKKKKSRELAGHSTNPGWSFHLCQDWGEALTPRQLDPTWQRGQAPWETVWGGWIILLGHGRVLTPAGFPGRTMERRREAGTDTREGLGAGQGHSDLWRCF